MNKMCDVLHVGTMEDLEGGQMQGMMVPCPRGRVSSRNVQSTIKFEQES
jgi:hypothetical protein